MQSIDVVHINKRILPYFVCTRSRAADEHLQSSSRMTDNRTPTAVTQRNFVHEARFGRMEHHNVFLRSLSCSQS